jgi:hypothetical protein
MKMMVSSVDSMSWENPRCVRFVTLAGFKYRARVLCTTSKTRAMEDIVEIPSDIDAVLKRLLSPVIDSNEQSMLAPEDELYLNSLIASIRSGRRSVLIVEDVDERLRFMFSNATRAEAMTMLGKVVEATGRRLAEGDD